MTQRSDGGQMLAAKIQNSAGGTVEDSTFTSD